MKIVITGNMGYVGARVVRHLRERFAAATLIGIDAGWFAHLLTNAEVAPETMLDAQYLCDVREVTEEMLRDVDAVVHLAGVSNDPIGNRFERATAGINVDGTVEVATRARWSGVKTFVFASSCSVYGYAEEGARNEQSAVNPLTAYAKSKIDAEAALQRLASPGFRVTSLRFATACGMSERLRLDLVVNQFVADAISRGEIRILSDGTPWRPLIDVNDMARAIEWAIGRDVKDGGDHLVLNCGRDEANYTVRDIAERVAAAIPGCRISINENAQPDKRSYRVDFSIYRRLAPSHQPQITLPQSIEALRDGLVAMQYRETDVHQSPFIRLRTLTGLQEAQLLTPELRWTRRQSQVRAAHASS